MYIILALLSWMPLVTFGLCRRFDGVEPWWRTALRIVALSAIGLAAASPYITSRGVGTGEAYNYSLALADAVTQLRAGEIPLVGQTEYAFNGRIHPLRNAPYLFYLAAGFDAVTRHRLNFWQLQNLTLAFSLFGTAFVTYGALRWGTGCRRSRAALFSVFYTLCPGLLGVANENLFMSVHAAFFVPIAIGACVRSGRTREWRNDFVLAAAVAGAWLAHPPIAFWLTLCVAVPRLVMLGFQPSWRSAFGLILAGAFGLCLSAFVFASEKSLSADLAFFQSAAYLHNSYVESVMGNLHRAFPAALLPVSQLATLLGDLQFGYSGWLFLFAIAGIILFGRISNRAQAYPRVIPTALVLIAGFFLLLVLPVPYVTPWLWHAIPGAIGTLTSPWPMQRLYLLASGLVVFALTALLSSVTLSRKLVWPLLGLALIWTGLEAGKFIRRGYALAWGPDMTRHAHLPSNLDLTVTSYAFLNVPPTFIHGVMDPLFEFAVQKRNGQEVASPMATALAKGTVVTRGEIRFGSVYGIQKTLSPEVILVPGKRYVLNFNFLTGQLAGTIDLIGGEMRRHYFLQSSGYPKGFGMGATNTHAIPLWTSASQPELLDIRFYVETWPPGEVRPDLVATFTLQEIDPTELPVKLISLFPLRFSVDAPESGCFATTPRAYLRGYRALVNGEEVRTVKSHDGQVAVPVPAGHSEVEIRFQGQPILYFAFWLSAVSWLVLLLLWLGYLAQIRWPGVLKLRTQRAFTRVWSRPTARWAAVAIVFGALAVAGVAKMYSNRDTPVGPVWMNFAFQSETTRLQQPLIDTGKTGAGLNLFSTYLDETHIRLSADIWGALYESGIIEIDATQPHILVMSSSGLFPLDHPKVKALGPWDRQRLRHEFLVELDGRTVISAPVSAYESKVEEIAFGKNAIGSSLSDPLFLGEIFEVKRLPIPQTWGVASDQQARLKFSVPADRTGHTECLAAINALGFEGVCAITYLDARRVRISWLRSDGSVIDAADADAPAHTKHELLLAFTESEQRIRARWIFDGKKLFGADAASLKMRPLSLTTGVAPANAAQAAERFTGESLTARIFSPEAKPAAKSGALRLLVTFPLNRIGQSEPLLATGKSGRGDMAYVTYVDAQHVRFALDHWGRGGAQSEPISLDYLALHEIEIRLGSLYPETTSDRAWGKSAERAQQEAKQTMTILIDGHNAVTAAFEAYPARPEEIAVARNSIGGSNSSAAFTGIIYAQTRLGLELTEPGAEATPAVGARN